MHMSIVIVFRSNLNMNRDHFRVTLVYRSSVYSQNMDSKAVNPFDTFSLSTGAIRI